MPVANRNGQLSFAAQIAAHEEEVEFLRTTPCPTDGLIYPPPVPKRPIVHRITMRLIREERERQRREILYQLYGDPPNMKGVP